MILDASCDAIPGKRGYSAAQAGKIFPCVQSTIRKLTVVEGMRPSLLEHAATALLDNCVLADTVVLRVQRLSESIAAARLGAYSIDHLV